MNDGGGALYVYMYILYNPKANRVASASSTPRWHLAVGHPSHRRGGRVPAFRSLRIPRIRRCHRQRHDQGAVG